MDRILYVDLDSTFWDTEPLYKEAMEVLFGKYIPDHEREDFDWPQKLGVDNWWDMFDYALHPSRIADRHPFPGACKALHDLHYYKGFGIHFCSHNPKPSLLYIPIMEWLSGLLDFPFDLTIFGKRNDKIDYMDTHEGAWGIIEDKPATIRKAVRRGYPTFVKKYTYNAKECDTLEVSWFHEWHTVPYLVTMSEGSQKGLLV